MQKQGWELLGSPHNRSAVCPPHNLEENAEKITWDMRKLGHPLEALMAVEGGVDGGGAGQFGKTPWPFTQLPRSSPQVNTL